MQTEIINKSVSEKFAGRMDANFLILVQKHMPLIDELAAKFTIEQLKDMCLRLPVVEDGKTILVSTQYPSANLRFNMRILDARLKRITNIHLVAAYVAVAAHGLAQRMLTEVEMLSKQKLEILGRLKGYLKEGSTGNTPLLEQAMKCDAYAKLEQVKSVS